MIVQRMLRNGDWRAAHVGARFEAKLTDTGVTLVCYGIDEKTGDTSAVRVLLTRNEASLIHMVTTPGYVSK